ncbi:head-tail adaptor protein [Limimaricola cinnabarinus]|uniref:Phage head-tail adapter protein n=1 Tax=Limimaricola cinnabarinus TaxID=1125964 RepID=A0A2G1MH68_9RHOB|nr:head-tail adaptor protein [Limimaricola cinnabarinus]PHP28002.1 phage head-tail adapter protein [Limimaricola cinnabarinus]
MGAAKLDRRVQFRRATFADNGFNSSRDWNAADPAADNLGSRIWAQKTDLSDGERWRAGEVAAHVTTRFVVRYSSFTVSITPADRIVCEGDVYEITGIKEGEGRRQWLEITCARMV